MSRDKKSSLAVSLATASCALLGTTAPPPVDAQEEPDWEFDTALLYYSESDDRVEDISLNVLAVRNFVDDRTLTLGLAVDSLTGATPYGAIPFSGAQTFTTPSGLQTRTTPPNVIPLDDTFLDTRYAVSGTWQQPLGRMNSFGPFSIKSDFSDHPPPRYQQHCTEGFRLNSIYRYCRLWAKARPEMCFPILCHQRRIKLGLSD